METPAFACVASYVDTFKSYYVVWKPVWKLKIYYDVKCLNRTM